MTKKESQPQPPVVKSIEELILNCQRDKYSAIPLAALWAKELHRREENRHITANEILELALREVLTGTVDWKILKKTMAAHVAGNAGTLESAVSAAKKSKE